MKKHDKFYLKFELQNDLTSTQHLQFLFEEIDEKIPKITDILGYFEEKTVDPAAFIKILLMKAPEAMMKLSVRAFTVHLLETGKLKPGKKIKKNKN